MATIRKRGNAWQALVRKQAASPITKTFLKRVDAERWAREIETDIERGVFVNTSPAQQTTLRTVLERYRDTITPTHKGAVDVNHSIERLNTPQLV